MDDANSAADSNRNAVYWICRLAMFTAALGFSLRAGASGAIKEALFDPVDPLHSGTMIATTIGYAFLGFALSLLVICPVLDFIGAKRIMLLAAACYIVGPLLIIASPHAGGPDTVYFVLGLGMTISGIGWGATEASINPVIAALFPNDKIARLNALHAWWPAGIIVGGLWSILVFNVLKLPWTVAMGVICPVGLVVGVWALGRDFPKTESTARGISFKDMLAEPVRRPSFWVFPAIMFLTASTELAPGSWVDIALSQTVGMPGVLVLVYVSALMFIGRHFAGFFERRVSDLGLLFLVTVPAGIGLYTLGSAAAPVPALIAATVWAVGVCFMWPTMLAAVAHRYPRGGSWTIGITAFAGALAIYYVLPELGKIYDRAKWESAGGPDAFAALQPGPELSRALAYAAEKSFQTVAIIPAVLFVIFGVLFLVDRRKKLGSTFSTSAAYEAKS